MTQQRRSVLVTGGSRGIGHAVVEELSKDHHVLVGGTRPDTVNEVVGQLDDAEPFIADLTDPQAVAGAVAAVDRLDAVVHSAGTYGSGNPLAQTPRSEWRDVLELNVVAVADLTAQLLPLLRDSHGQIVMINSGSGLHRPGPRAGVYAASKYALRALTDALREEERGAVRVTTVYPGRVNTDMQVNRQHQMGHEYAPDEHLRPESIAAAVRMALEASSEAMVEDVSVRPVVK
ncbi:SDR family oxidoreductase [uncultured Cutibacterium sp.]|uniref:SDR family oxidoreductase n=1 Tax=uncultured Cutibacterium sp. TaxID=1912223 RepID=UPI00280417C1|nr:SDR family oxidoreductase [uncultured Cutibacterium sp.]MDU1581132.1 SDR family oxidoreductase [Cutibacterium granulosum]